MFLMGHFRQIDALPTLSACPLRSDRFRNSAPQRNDAEWPRRMLFVSWLPSKENLAMSICRPLYPPIADIAQHDCDGREVLPLADSCTTTTNITRLNAPRKNLITQTPRQRAPAPTAEWRCLAPSRFWRSPQVQIWWVVRLGGRQAS